MAKEHNYKFTCPECNKQDKIDEVMIEVIQYSPVSSIAETNDGDAYCDYDPSEIRTEDGEIARYQCCHCGFCVQDEYENDISEPSDLYKWLKKRDMIIVPDTEN